MKVDFTKNSDGLVPAIIQDAKTGKVLMLGYMNKESLEITEASGKVTFWSRSRQKLWTKGETSGHILRVHSIRVDCDHDTLLIEADPKGPTCHTGTESCFGDNLPSFGAQPAEESSASEPSDTAKQNASSSAGQNAVAQGENQAPQSIAQGYPFLAELAELIHTRRIEAPQGSYTTLLFQRGIKSIAQKVGEEAVELIIASLKGDKEEQLNEAADLLYHLLVLLEENGYTLEDVEAVLAQRHK